MNKKQRKELSTFPILIDKAINEKYGIEAHSQWSLISGKWHTYFECEDEQLQKQVEAFIDGFVQGGRELADRLRNC